MYKIHLVRGRKNFGGFLSGKILMVYFEKACGVQFLKHGVSCNYFKGDGDGTSACMPMIKAFFLYGRW